MALCINASVAVGFYLDVRGASALCVNKNNKGKI
jgi:hypothetical protein